MLHSIAIAVHAVAATISLLAGLFAVRDGRLFAIYRYAMHVMAAALAVAVLIGWSFYPLAGALVFTALLGLAVVMVVRAELAARSHRAGSRGRSFQLHVGFTLISLGVGFVVVALSNAGFGVLGAGAGLAVIVLGRLLLHRLTTATPVTSH